MEIEEFEQRLHDAEIRLARLKALYEQWFQGIERIEPGIARKELERSLDALKREQPRNTALRFRCQQLAARYSTYGIYWGRIAKQIEDGTYRRDVQRAKAKAQKAEREQKTFELDVEIDGFESDGLEGLEGFGDSDLDAIFGALSSSPEVSASPARTSMEPKTFGKPSRAEPARAVAAASRAAPATEPRPAPGQRSRDAAGATADERRRAPRRSRPAPHPGRIASGQGHGGTSGHPGRAAAHGRRGARRADTGPATSARQGTWRLRCPPPSSGAIAIGRMARPAPVTGGVREEAGSHSRSSRPVDGPSSAVRPAAPVGARPPAPPGPPRPAAASSPVARPAAASPPTAARPPAAAAGPDMSALYQRYVDARRQNNERVDNVRFESLQQSVEKMMPKLREKHGNKAIDFEVVLQDGKVGLKPKVRG